MKILCRVPAILVMMLSLLFIPSAPTVTVSAAPVAVTATSDATLVSNAAGKSAKEKAKEKKAKEKAAKEKAAKEAAAKAKAEKEAAEKAAREAAAKEAAAKAAAAKAAAAEKACQEAITKAPIYAPKGLTISCVKHDDPSLHGSNGYSSTTMTTERVWIDISTPSAINMVAHEFSHGYSWQVMTPALRLEFAKKVGKRTWTDGDYAVRPSEVWAYNQGRCHGYPLNYGYTKIDCSVITDFETKVGVPIK